jgi:hypothetical protein
MQVFEGIVTPQHGIRKKRGHFGRVATLCQTISLSGILSNNLPL